MKRKLSILLAVGLIAGSLALPSYAATGETVQEVQTIWVVGTDSSHTTSGSWSYQNERISESGNKAELTAKLTKLGAGTTYVDISLSCTPSEADKIRSRYNVCRYFPILHSLRSDQLTIRNGKPGGPHSRSAGLVLHEGYLSLK